MLVPTLPKSAKTRARTGCTTCRARHVKCDETKPNCLRCMKFWGVCEGYGPSEARPRKKKTPEKVIGAVGARDAPRRVAGIPAKFPWHALTHTETEERYFRLFREQTASTLAGYFKYDIWNRLLWQMCPREEFVRHAIIAIAALDKTMEVAGNHSVVDLNHLSISVRQSADVHHQVALHHYGRALKLMRKLSPKDVHYLRNTLIGCLVTTCFEAFHGNQEGALVQTLTGINILSDYKELLKTSKPRYNMIRNPDADREIEDELVEVFNRLELQTLLFRAKRTGEQNDSLHREGLALLEEMPAAFHSFAEARAYFDVLINVIMYWRVHMYHIDPTRTTFAFSSFRSSAPITSTPPVSSDNANKLQAGFDMHMTIIHRFRAAFKPIFLTSRTKNAAGNFPADYAGATIMMLILTMTNFPQPSGHSELWHDTLLPEFKYALALSREVLEHEGAGKKVVFHFDIMGVVAALFMVATRCRDRMVRRGALTLLRRYPRREGLWDSVMASTLAAWLIRAEEEGLEGDFVPESARLRIVTNDFDLSNRKSVLTCSKYVEGREERVFLPQVVIRW